MTENEIKKIANKLRNRILLYIFLFVGVFGFLLGRYDKLNDIFILILCTSVFFLGCATYFAEKLVIAVMAKKEE